jgi:cell division protein FtsB
MNKILKWVAENGLTVLLIAVLLYVFFFKGSNSDTNSRVKETNEDVKILHSEMDSLKQIVEFSAGRLMQLEVSQMNVTDMIMENNRIMHDTKKEIIKLQKVYNEKIRSVDNYTRSQRDSFFTKRYSEYY